MPTVRWFGPLVLGCLALAAPAAAQTKMPPPGSTAPPTDIEGKSLPQWLADTKHPDPSVREEAIRAIVLFGPPNKDVLDALIDRTLDPDASPRVRAVMMLGVVDLSKEDTPRVVEALAKRLSSEPGVGEPQAIVRYQAAVALARFGDQAKAAIPGLVIATEDRSSFEIRRAAVITLAGAGFVKDGPADTRAVRALARAVHDQAVQVRLEAVLGLGRLGKCGDMQLQQLVERTLRDLAADRDQVLATWAVVSLMMIDHPVDTLIGQVGKRVKSPDFRVRLNAVRAIGIMGPKAKAFVPDLVEALGDKEQAVVFQAILALANMGADGTPAVSKLTELSERKEGDERIKAAAKYALEQIKKPVKP